MIQYVIRFHGALNNTSWISASLHKPEVNLKKRFSILETNQFIRHNMWVLWNDELFLNESINQINNDRNILGSINLSTVSRIRNILFLRLRKSNQVFKSMKLLTRKKTKSKLESIWESDIFNQKFLDGRNLFSFILQTI